MAPKTQPSDPEQSRRWVRQLITNHVYYSGYHPSGRAQVVWPHPRVRASCGELPDKSPPTVSWMPHAYGGILVSLGLLPSVAGGIRGAKIFISIAHSSSMSRENREWIGRARTRRILADVHPDHTPDFTMATLVATTRMRSGCQQVHACNQWGV